ncbi:MAG: hypothetical protein RMJ33_08250 [Saprospiraceae bacterium]|nr:hypothetical protein [Saprospiraceae bacterium]MDW8229814.1 hypothetical protein [Saprospiraceae bacterium]
MCCPNCGHAAQAHYTRCRHCNYKLPQTATPGAAPAAEVIACWNCAAPNPAHHSRCACCNARLEDAPAQRRTHSITSNAYRHGQPQER